MKISFSDITDIIKRLPSGLAQRCRSCLWNSRKNYMFFLMFHEVTRSSGEHLLESEDYSITLSNFNALLSSLISRDVGFCDIDDVFSGRIPASGKAAVITFDDVFKSVIENALPVLTEKRIPFTVFISECFIDKDGYLSSDDILILRENGLCTIGFHGRSHDKLREVMAERAPLCAG